STSVPFFSQAHVAPRDLPSFPTRCASDLLGGLRRLLRLPLGEITHQPRQLRRLGPNRRRPRGRFLIASQVPERVCDRVLSLDGRDRKSTRLNSSHVSISYAVFCLKKKKKN